MELFLQIYLVAAAVIVLWLTTLRVIDRRAERKHAEYISRLLAEEITGRWAGQNQQEGER